MPEPFKTIAKVFGSTARKMLAGFFFLCLVLSVFFDSQGTGMFDAIAAFFGTVGWGGGLVFFGANLLRFVPDDLPNRWQFIGLAIFCIIGGALFLLVGLASIWLY